MTLYFIFKKTLRTSVILMLDVIFLNIMSVFHLIATALTSHALMLMAN